MDEDGSVEQQQRLLLVQEKQEQQRRRQLRPTPPASAYRRQTCFFQHLARALRPGARAVGTPHCTVLLLSIFICSASTFCAVLPLPCLRKQLRLISPDGSTFAEKPLVIEALQFYPDNAEQLESLTSAALRCGFEGGLVVDYPNSTKAKKYFLCLWLPGGARHKTQQMPKALGTSAILNAGRERPIVSGRRAKKLISKREWIAKKKEQQKMKGKNVRPQSKYTGRKRKDRF
ncbi:hypothetical protein ACSSS7_003210 [Eimeria intestinalis]